MALFRKRLKRAGDDLVAKKGKGGIAKFEDPIVARESVGNPESAGFEDPIVARQDFEVPVFLEDDPTA